MELIRMKIPIKKEYYKYIEQGKKPFEWREAHFTFVDDKTGEILGRHKVHRCAVVRNEVAKSNCWIKEIKKDWDKLFKEDMIMQFSIDEKY